MNDADRKAFEEWYKKQIWGNASWKNGVFEGFEFGLEWRDSQVGEPVAWLFSDYTWTPIKAMGKDHNGKPVYFAPPAAQINQQLVEALEFFVDRFEPIRSELIFSKRLAIDKAKSALAAATQMRGDA